MTSQLKACHTTKRQFWLLSSISFIKVLLSGTAADARVWFSCNCRAKKKKIVHFPSTASKNQLRQWRTGWKDRKIVAITPKHGVVEISTMDAEENMIVKEELEKIHPFYCQLPAPMKPPVTLEKAKRIPYVMITNKNLGWFQGFLSRKKTDGLQGGKSSINYE